MHAAEYWAGRFSADEGVAHHRLQNAQISSVFLRNAHERRLFRAALSQDRIIEIGCGTGELSAAIQKTYSTGVFYGTDFSREAVRRAQEQHLTVNFWLFDILNDELDKRFDLAISSNTLEHFLDPYAVLERMFVLAPQVILLVPYQQPVTDHYRAEGGAGHVVEFREESFAEYQTLDSFLFETPGWQHSSAGEKPQQLAVLLAHA